MSNTAIEELQARLDRVITRNHHEFYFKGALAEAIAALRTGNYGIGALAVNKNRIIVGGRNRIFHPTFDPGHHAEHDVLHNLKCATGKESFTATAVYTSLETTCPVCLLELMAAGIKKVYYPISVPSSENLLIESVISGYRSMRQRISKTAHGVYEAVPVSAALSQLAIDIFNTNRLELDREILQRGGLTAELTHLNLHAAGREALTVRPNTGLPEHFIQENMIVCTGEDPRELVHAMQTALPGVTPEVHNYRCYYAWKYPGFTVLISGIGTGCLEPLMYEILDRKALGDKVAKRLVMIGTAGYLADSGFGKVYLVDGAYPVGCAVSLEDVNLPVRPRFDGIESLAMSRAEEISTDYYYAATPTVTDQRKVAAKAKDPALCDGLDKHWKAGRLISMETAQFYHFASVYGDADTQWVSFRGVANLADQFDTQGEYSQAVLTEAFNRAVSLLIQPAK